MKLADMEKVVRKASRTIDILHEQLRQRNAMISQLIDALEYVAGRTPTNSSCDTERLQKSVAACKQALERFRK